MIVANPLKIKTAEDSDQKRWDKFVLRHPNSSPYHLFAWKKAVEDAYGHKCYYFYAEEKKEIVGILPTVNLRLIGVINELVGLPFCDVGNCIAINEKVQDALCNEAILYKNRNHSKKIQLRGNLIQTDNVLKWFCPIESDKVRMLFNLPSSSEDLFKSFKSKLRSQIRKAEKNGVVFEWGGIDDIDSAYDVFSRNMHELGSPVHSKLFLKAVLENYGNRSRLGIAKIDGSIIGMGIILLSENCVSIPWASTLMQHNRLAPNMLLYWNFLKYSADNGFTFFDFGRSSEGEGTYNFKKQWGANPVPLTWYEYKKTNADEGKKKLSTVSGKRQLVASIWKNFPLCFVNMVGPRIRKYISL